MCVCARARKPCIHNYVYIILHMCPCKYASKYVNMYACVSMYICVCIMYVSNICKFLLVLRIAESALSESFQTFHVMGHISPVFPIYIVDGQTSV